MSLASEEDARLFLAFEFVPNKSLKSVVPASAGTTRGLAISGGFYRIQFALA